MKELIYKIADFLTGGRGLTKTINGFRITFPFRYANYFPENYEESNFRFLRDQVTEGDIVLDIGAHIGLFSVAASTQVKPKGKVYAFEPAEETIPLLAKTVFLNQATDTISIIQAAVGEKSGTTTFYVSDIKGDNSNSLISYKDDRKLFAKEVTLYSIDEFIKLYKLKNLRFIKLDVEGAELDALKGASETLKNMRPACIVAIHPEPILAKGDTLEDIYDLIIEQRYQISLDGKSISREAFCSNRNLIDLHILPIT